MKAISFWIVLKITSAAKHICVSMHIFPDLSNLAVSSTESVICHNLHLWAGSWSSFPRRTAQPWAQQYHLTQQELDVFFPADGTFSHGREQATGYHFRPSISTWPIRTRPSWKTPLGSFCPHLRRKINCAVLRENYCCLFLRTASAVTIWSRELGSESLRDMSDLFASFGKPIQIWPSYKSL